MLEYKPIQFFNDELPHKNIIEWWYFNGNLTDAKGNRYAFMDCLFKADPKRVKIPFLRVVPLKEVYFSHALLSDISKNKFYSEINPLVLVSKDSFTKDLFFVNYAAPSFNGYFNSEIKKIDENSWYLKTQYFELTLKNKKPPLLVAGNGFLDLGPNSTYYYSLTDLETSGEIIVEGKRIAVSGQSWMDHQWADATYSSFKWSWFSLQLKNNIEIVCFRFESKKDTINLASVIYNDGRQKTYNDLELESLGQNWQSPETGTIYPLTWQIKIPSAHIDLQVKPFVKEQEMIFGLINYWEGGLEVTGSYGNKPISGLGFMELVGYPSKKGRLSYYQKTLTKNLKSYSKKFFSK
ncbi:MAG: lipocalin family protein [Patescibacteria group bacterium]